MSFNTFPEVILYFRPIGNTVKQLENRFDFGRIHLHIYDAIRLLNRMPTGAEDSKVECS